MKNGDKPIYPLQSEGFPSHEKVVEEAMVIGLTKREYFAAMAMQGLLSIFQEHEQNPIVPNESNTVYMAALSVKAADALLAELERNK